MPTISRTAMTDDDGTGTTGTIINNAWKTQLYDQIDALAAQLSPLAGSASIVTLGTVTAGVWNAGAVTSSGAIKERGRSDAMGEWIVQPFDAAEFTANGSMTWTVASGDVLRHRYMLVGKTLTMAFDIEQTTVGGTPSTELRIRVPGGFAAAAHGTQWGAVIVSDNGGAFAIGGVYVSASGNFIRIHKDATLASNWAASTNATRVAGTFTFEIA